MAGDLAEKALEIVEVARATGKIKKGANEATKALERGIAKLVVYAKDVSPPEIVMHLAPLAKERGVPCVEVPGKADLGNAAGVNVPTSAVAIVEPGEGEKLLKEIESQLGIQKEPENK